MAKARAKKKQMRKPMAKKKKVAAKKVATRQPLQLTVKATPERVKAEEKPLNASQIQRLRDILVQKRDELLEVVQRKKEQEFEMDEPEIGDEADIATRSVERELLFDVTDTEKVMLDDIEAALRRVEKISSVAANRVTV